MLHRNWKSDRLHAIEPFAHLSKRALREVGTLTTLLRLPAGKVLWEQGERAQEAFLLLEGELELTWDGTPLETVRPGVIVGGIGLNEGAPRLATATTVTEVDALVMTRLEYRQLVRLCPDVERHVQAGHRARFSSVRVAALA